MCTGGAGLLGGSGGGFCGGLGNSRGSRTGDASRITTSSESLAAPCLDSETDTKGRGPSDTPELSLETDPKEATDEGGGEADDEARIDRSSISSVSSLESPAPPAPRGRFPKTEEGDRVGLGGE